MNRCDRLFYECVHHSMSWQGYDLYFHPIALSDLSYSRKLRERNYCTVTVFFIIIIIIFYFIHARRYIEEFLKGELRMCTHRIEDGLYVTKCVQEFYLTILN